MKILGMPIRFGHRRNQMMVNWGKGISFRFNRLPLSIKRQVILLVFILFNFLFGILLIQGMKGNSPTAIMVEVPFGELPMIYSDTLLRTPLNQLFYEKTQ